MTYRKAFKPKLCGSKGGNGALVEVVEDAATGGVPEAIRLTRGST